MYFNWKIGYMKKIIVSLAVCCVIATGCYDDYTMDYEYTGIYSAYQYDLRTFVVGEGMKFDFTVALGGVPSLAYGKSVKTSQFIAGRRKRDNLLHIRKSIAHIRLAQSPEPSHAFQTIKCSKRRCTL